MSPSSDLDHHKLTKFFFIISIFITGISILAVYSTIMATVSTSESHRQQGIYIQTLSKYQSYLSKLHADKSVTDSLANLAYKAQTEQKLYEQSQITSSQYSKFVEAYDLVTVLLVIGVGLGGISEIAKNKLLGYPSFFVGGFGIAVLLLISFMPATLLVHHILSS